MKQLKLTNSGEIELHDAVVKPYSAGTGRRNGLRATMPTFGVECWFQPRNNFVTAQVQGRDLCQLHYNGLQWIREHPGEWQEFLRDLSDHPEKYPELSVQGEQ